MKLFRSISSFVFTLVLVAFCQAQVATAIPIDYSDARKFSAGMSETYFIKQTTDTFMTSQDGLFLLQDNMMQQETEAFIAVYTVVHSDETEPFLRLRVDAYPVDSDSRQFIFAPVRTNTYRVNENGVIQNGADDVAIRWFMQEGEILSDTDEGVPLDATLFPRRVNVLQNEFGVHADVKSNTRQLVGWDEHDGIESVKIKEKIVKEGRTEDDIVQLHWIHSREGEHEVMESQLPWSAYVVDEIQAYVTVQADALQGMAGSFHMHMRRETQVERIDMAFNYASARIEKGRVVDSAVAERRFVSTEGEPLDLYEIYGLAQERIRIRTDGDINEMMVFDEARRLVASETMPSDDFFVLEYDIPATGTYFIAVQPSIEGETSNSRTPYALAVESLGVYVDTDALRIELRDAFTRLDEILAEKTWEQAIDAWEESLHEVRMKVPLTIRNVQLVRSRPMAYGEYAIRGNNVYAVGDIVHIYAEPVNVHSEYTGERYEMSLSAGAELHDEKGRIVASYPDVVVVNKRTYRRLRDIHIGLALWLGDVPEGKYEWHITIRDGLSGQEARHTVPIVVN